ncbi:anaerobic carbon-monoxide dehydrogenase catalytic subunit [Thermodesulfatator autotrophicus]|uniref:Carbon monoxide dehydrogenase n=1 Tax=Thermodesulfatator autotrophicus TaxID=1795632 RepID=A0A177E5P6_9BACT|nr:anaerobic carbon-monoxide dehydrogenase catalytic subunit [Thermodesulfatator autotrophicus]OAG27098.1 carbon monoxide dehydrogenase [Thermodesulfatator autotrophicus]
MPKKKRELGDLSVDPAVLDILSLARKEDYETVWDRLERQSPHCKFGTNGVCCRNCIMGPCRVTEKNPRGVCGADAATIVARNLIRALAAGAAAHSDHGRAVAVLFNEVARDENKEYQISDEAKLKAIAEKLNIDTSQDISSIAREVARMALEDFGKQDEAPLNFLKAYAPQKRKETWQKVEQILFSKTDKKMGILPRNIDREITECMHRTTMGVDNQALSILAQGVRTALADGWGGSLIATELQDVLFGTPDKKVIKANLGVLKEDQVNIIVHGHEPILSEQVVAAAMSPEMQEKAKQVGAKGINVAGICCTANEVLMRRGVPVAGNMIHQELAIMTGVVEAMVVDVQCIFPSLGPLAKCFHTRFISTSDRAAFPEAIHVQFDEHHAREVAQRIVEMAIDAYSERDPQKVHIPKEVEEAVVGFSVEEIIKILGGSPKPLVDAILAGKIKGVVGIVGCNNPKVKHDAFHISLTRELIKKDILVIGTGCWAIAAAKAGLMKIEAQSLAGEGLKEVCQALDIPPVLHMGSCVDCSRMLVLAGALADYLKVDISDLPLVGSAPEWMTEKAVSIGTYFVASGVPVHLWPMPPIGGSEEVVGILTEGIKELLGGYFFVEEDPVKTASLMEEIIMEKRKSF